MEDDKILSPGEAAAMLGIDPKTLSRWAKTNVIEHITLPKGHRRYRLSVINKILNNTNN